MRSTLTRGAATAVLPTLGLLVLAGCGGGDSSSGSGSPSAPASSAPATTPSSASPSTTASPTGQQADVTLNVTVANGKVNPSGATIKVKAGQTVLVTAVSDTADELHIHGYDKELELSPGKTTSVTFTANMKGTFEVETHESGKLVAKLVVS